MGRIRMLALLERVWLCALRFGLKELCGIKASCDVTRNLRVRSEPRNVHAGRMVLGSRDGPEISWEADTGGRVRQSGIVFAS